MTGLRVAKSETRDLAERDRVQLLRALNQPTDWQMSNSTFFVAFVVIAAVLTILALILR
ncbi:MAG TPA: hypothetical protein VMZ53_17150 [Kofleriaceae bacterium]|nr:hypothetical protein [Kofleriaceae bacterium]